MMGKMVTKTSPCDTFQIQQWLISKIGSTLMRKFSNFEKNNDWIVFSIKNKGRSQNLKSVTWPNWKIWKSAIKKFKPKHPCKILSWKCFFSIIFLVFKFYIKIFIVFLVEFSRLRFKISPVRCDKKNISSYVHQF